MASSKPDKTRVQLPKNSRAAWSDPSQSEKEKLNRFEKLSRGTSLVTSEVTPLQMMSILKDKSLEGFEPSQVMHGPLSSTGNNPKAKSQILIEMQDYRRRGKMHVFWEKCQREAAAKDEYYKNNFRGVNFVVPTLTPSDKEMPFFQNSVILSDPDDCQHIARNHIKKQPGFSAILFQSLIATTDNQHWAKQRNYLNEVFLPDSSLSKIFPTSWKRAKFCTNKLADLANKAGQYGVQMHEFFLHEAQAQLQLALFGMDETFMEETNSQIRDGKFFFSFFFSRCCFPPQCLSKDLFAHVCCSFLFAVEKVFAGVHKNPEGTFGALKFE